MSISAYRVGTCFGISMDGGTYVWNGHSFWPSYQDQGFTETFSYGTTNLYHAASTFDLTGFQVGNEAVMFVLVWRADSSYTGYIDTQILDAEGTILYSTSNYIDFDINGYSGWEGWLWLGIGVRPKPWPELWYNGTYNVVVSGLINSMYSFSTTNLDTNVLTRYSGNEGYVWVEGNNLWYISEIGCKHYLRNDGTTSSAGSANAGHIWIDNSQHKICWVDSGGTIRKSKRGDMYWITDWDGDTVFAGSSNKGYLWANDDPHWTCLEYVASDGYVIRQGPGYVGSSDMQ